MTGIFPKKSKGGELGVGSRTRQHREKDLPGIRERYFILLKDFIYLFMRDTERERQRQRQREKQAPCRELDVGPDPGTPGPRPGLKAGTKLLSHPGIPVTPTFLCFYWHMSFSILLLYIFIT